ncbi:MAG: hypothetical protein ACE1ZB_00775 [Gammaproteobacteria bacterium]
MYREVLYAGFVSLQGCNLSRAVQEQLPRSKKPAMYREVLYAGKSGAPGSTI